MCQQTRQSSTGTKSGQLRPHYLTPFLLQLLWLCISDRILQHPGVSCCVILKLQEVINPSDTMVGDILLEEKEIGWLLCRGRDEWPTLLKNLETIYQGGFPQNEWFQFRSAVLRTSYANSATSVCWLVPDFPYLLIVHDALCPHIVNQQGNAWRHGKMREVLHDPKR